MNVKRHDLLLIDTVDWTHIGVVLVILVYFVWMGFFYSRADYVCLPSFFEFASYGRVCDFFFFLRDDFSRDLCTPWWEFVEYRNVEVTVDGERERTGDGSSGHRKKMRCRITFVSEGAALRSAEAMLFIDYRIGKVLELHGFLDKRVSADKHCNLSACYPFQELRARNICRFAARYFGREFLAARTGDERDIDGEVLEILDKRFEML